MPSLVHEIAVARLSQDPTLLYALAERLLGKSVAARLRPIDAVLRLANPEEIRPDLLLGRGKRGPWDAIEVQRRIDRTKVRRWPLLLAVLRDQRRCMGDLWVITASRRAAEWAKGACDEEGPQGTRLRIKPVVLWLNPKQIDALLDEGAPSLAFFAAWAMQARYGTRAAEVVERALDITGRLPKPLRRRQSRDIVNVLNERVVAMLKERIMDATDDRESPWVKQWREELYAVALAKAEAHVEAKAKAKGEAKGKQEALRAVLAARGLPLSSAEQAKVASCSDLAKLDRWITRAATATTIAEVLRAKARPSAPGSRRSKARATTL